MVGKWSQAGIPHKGWSCVGVEDLGAPEATCEMCETQEIRYVHTMHHPDYLTELGVGCICAERMEDDYLRPRQREKALRSAAGRKKRWLSRAWKVSARGNPFINTDGFNITIFHNADDSWGGRIEERETGRSVVSKRKYQSEDAAKLAAFDGMVFLKTKRGWG
ncbi:MAG: hypothetical protein QOJ84_3764 [Bradyrhizobium sp.]|jgi:hypothetical protein|nr:hypothetical protein [Bradyrhizobium sp.]